MDKVNTLQSVKYARSSGLQVLDQLLLPNQSVYVNVRSVQETWDVIRSMQVRGAPLIAITAALGLAVEAEVKRGAQEFTAAEDAANYLLQQMDFLRTSRPTAVNLFTATEELSALVGRLRADSSSTADSLLEGFIAAAESMLEADISANRAMGKHGAEKILQVVAANRAALLKDGLNGKTTSTGKIRVLTICNTGSLATAGFGTALGVVRSLHEMGQLEHIYACETRPYNQGARLTAFEIVADNLPGTLIADSMASALMAVKGIDCVVVGADRIAANGDTANKVGTYQLAIAAQFHRVPFFVAAPTTTLDVSMATGEEIVIEERPPQELTMIFGQQLAAAGIAAWNPAFDVTPCRLIRGIITEIGVAESARSGLPEDVGNDIISIPQFLQQHSKEVVVVSGTQQHTAAAVEAKLREQQQTHAEPSGYSELHDYRVTDYVLANPQLVQLLQLDASRATAELPLSTQMKVKEVGDGNLNYVYIVEGNAGTALVLKQALPYVRCVGESWPLTLRRAYFEYKALTAHGELTGGKFVPQVHLFDEKEALIVMQFIPPPHLILRKALIQRMRIGTFAADVGKYMAATLFGSSALKLTGGELRTAVAHWSHNIAMCALTEKVIFTDPYTICEMNRWTTPQLDTYAAGIRSDTALKVAASYFKSLFVTSTQALLHGDLHTGSVMVAEGSTYVIDPEFAFYGPMGFDLGAMLANLFLAYFSQAGSNSSSDGDGDYPEWILMQTTAMYEVFVSDFTALWDAAAAQQDFAGEIYNGSVYEASSSSLKAAQSSFLTGLWWDAVGFAGMKMIRRIVGIAHVEDLECIEDKDNRAICEKRALLFARRLVLSSFSHNSGSTEGQLQSMQQLTALARSMYSSTPSNAWPTA